MLSRPISSQSASEQGPYQVTVSAIAKHPVYVVDDNLEMCESIRGTLTSVGCDVETFDNGPACLQAVRSKAPACLVVDLLMPGMTGLQFCRELFAISPESAVVMITGHGDVKSAVEAMKLGVLDFLEKPFGREQLLETVNRGIQQAAWRQLQCQEESEVADRIESLTPREREILQCISDGFVTKQIATKLGISTRTVDVHRSNISQKLRIDSPTHLTRVMFLHRRGQERRKSRRQG
ncbi:MAG: response regulator transcription factor [Aureliella sp.]